MKLAAAHPWPDTSETQRETSSDDNYFDKHRPFCRRPYSTGEVVGFSVAQWPNFSPALTFRRRQFDVLDLIF
jgi:hypothetical protein